MKIIAFFMMLCLCNVFAENNLRFLQNEILANFEYSGVFQDKDIIFKFEEKSGKITINYDGKSIDGDFNINKIDDVIFRVHAYSDKFEFNGLYDNNKSNFISASLYYNNYKDEIELTATTNTATTTHHVKTIVFSLDGMNFDGLSYDGDIYIKNYPNPKLKATATKPEDSVPQAPMEKRKKNL